MPWKIGLIGTGNVASFWTKNLNGFDGIKLYIQGSSAEKTLKFSTFHGVTPLDSKEVDFYLICVQDANIDSVISSLPEQVPIFICAGLFSIKEFAERRIGIIYPLQTIQSDALPSFNSVPFLCEFSPNSRDIGLKFLNEMELEISEVSEQNRFSAHLAAVFINNFGYYLMKNGLRFAMDHHISPELFKPLINNTISNLLINKDLQTGPARRNDHITLRTHESMLTDDFLNIYKTLTAFIQNSYRNEL